MPISELETSMDLLLNEEREGEIIVSAKSSDFALERSKTAAEKSDAAENPLIALLSNFLSENFSLW